MRQRTGKAAKPNEVRVTTPYMTKYERARVLGTRALQIRSVWALAWSRSWYCKGIQLICVQYERARPGTCGRRDGSLRNRIEGAGSQEDPARHKTVPARRAHSALLRPS